MQEYIFQEKMAIASVEISIGSGSKKLKYDELGVEEQHNAISLGTKRVMPRKHLKKMSSIRTAVNKYLHEQGQPFLNGFIVPLDKKDEVNNKLSELQDEFNRIFAEMQFNWDEDNKEYLNELRNSGCYIVNEEDIPDKKEFIQNIKFLYHVYQIAIDTDTNKKSLEDHIQNLKENFATNIGERIHGYIMTGLLDRERAMTESSLSEIIKISDKVYSFCSLYPEFAVLNPPLDSAINELRKSIGIKEPNLDNAINDLRRIDSMGKILHLTNLKVEKESKEDLFDFI